MRLWGRGLRKQKNSNKVEIVGIAGSSTAVGATHISVMMAEYTAVEIGAKTALLECNDHKDFERISQALFEESRNQFSLLGVDYYSRGQKQECVTVEELAKKGYRFIFLDLGERLTSHRSELLLCTRKVMIGTDVPWKNEEMIQKINYLSKDWKFIFNLSSKGIGYCPFGKGIGTENQKILNNLLMQ